MKKKINVIDVFIILTLVFTLVGVGLRIYFDILEESKTGDYTVVLKFSGISEDNRDEIFVGEEAEWKEKSAVLGKIVDVEYSPHKNTVFDGANKYTEVVENGKIDITVKVKVNGEMTDTGFKFAGRHHLSCGMNVTVETKNFEGNAIVMDISTENQ